MIDNIEKLSDELKVTSHFPPGRSEAHFDNNKLSPVALINLRPFFNINLIHISLFSRIKKLQENEINVILVLYDNTVLYAGLSQEIRTKTDSANAMDYVYEAAIRFGVNPSMLEVMPESVIWKCANYNSEILGSLVRLAYSIGEQGQQDNTIKHKALNYYLDVMLGITYEGLLKPDFVFSSGREVEAWKQIRARTSLSKIYGDAFIPPVIFNIPDIFKHDKCELLSTDEIDDLFAKPYKIDNLTKCSKLCNEKYIESINIVAELEGFELCAPEKTIDAIRKKMYD